MRNMIFNTYTDGDPRSFFYYDGDYYINGTEIMLKDEYINNHTWAGQKLWKYAKYHHQTIYNGTIAYFFCRSRSDWLSLTQMDVDIRSINDYAPFFVVQGYELYGAIETFVKPIKLPKEQTEKILQALVTPQRHAYDKTLLAMWILYILILAVSLIFTQFYVIWFLVSCAFFKWRKERLGR